MSEKLINLSNLAYYDSKIKQWVNDADYASKNYVNAQIATGGVQYLGTVDSVAGLSISATKGDYYRVITEFKNIDETVTAHAGDLIFAEVDNPLQVIYDSLNDIGADAGWIVIHCHNGMEYAVNEDSILTLNGLELDTDFIKRGTGENSLNINQGVATGKNAVAIGRNTYSEDDSGHIAENANGAIGTESFSIGTDNLTGSMAYTIVAVDETNMTYTLDGVDGLAVGDVYSLRLSCIKSGEINAPQKYNVGKITAITGNVVTVDTMFGPSNVGAGYTFNYIDPSNNPNFIDENGIDYETNAFRIIAKPHVGNRLIGSSTIALGSSNKALSKNAIAEGWGTIAYGSHAHAEGYATEASYAAHSEGKETLASGFQSHAEGLETIASGTDSHAEGRWSKATSDQAHAEGLNTTASGKRSHAEGDSSEATGQNSHAEGMSSEASGETSHAEGHSTVASGNKAHAEGNGTKAIGAASHSEGLNTTAEKDQTHAEGYNTTASGKRAHAEGHTTTASAESAHAEGYTTTASGEHSHAEGKGGTTFTPFGNVNTIDGFNDGSFPVTPAAAGNQSHAEGLNTRAKGIASHAEGTNTYSYGNYSHAEGNKTTAYGSHSHAEGLQTVAQSDQTHAEGYNTKATGKRSHAEGNGTTASNESAHAEGFSTTSKGIASHTEGNSTTAEANYSHAEGNGTTASGNQSHAEGSETTASGSSSHAEGLSTVASNDQTHAEGYNTKATGNKSHAEGHSTIAKGAYSHAGGLGTIAAGDGQTAIGKYNKEDSTSLFIVGKGTGDSASLRSNAFVVNADGRATVGKDPSGNMDVATKQYVDSHSGGVSIEDFDSTYFTQASGKITLNLNALLT